MTFRTTFVLGLAIAALDCVQAASAVSDAADRAQATIAYSDAVDRALSDGDGANPGSLPGHIDRYELDLPSGSVNVGAAGSGIDIEWSQVGVGIDVGMVFVLGLILVVRLTRGRPRAQG
jgi:hypothetical protein